MRYIELSRGRVAKVDDGDYEHLNQWKWTYSAQGYAYRFDRTGDKPVAVLMHRLLLEAPRGKQVDHINLDKLDNQRLNLRLCTSSQNLANKRSRASSGYKGVYWSKQNKKWYACITIEKKTMPLGHYDNILEAAKAYKTAAFKYYGEFARV